MSRNRNRIPNRTRRAASLGLMTAGALALVAALPLGCALESRPAGGIPSGRMAGLTNRPDSTPVIRANDNEISDSTYEAVPKAQAPGSAEAKQAAAGRDSASRDDQVRTTGAEANSGVLPGTLAAAARLEALPDGPQFPIDLNTSLRLAEVQNPEIARARTAILGALAVQQQANALLFPTLNAGVTYVGHVGNWQRSFGQINNLSDQFLYFGGGAGIIGVAGTVPIPAIQIFSPLTDAVFEPLAARQNLNAAQFEASATANQILLQVTSLYFDLLGTEARLDIGRETVAQNAEIARLTRNYFKTGQGRKADADRAETEYLMRIALVQKTEEDVAVAAAKLSRALHLDPSIRLRPAYQPFQPIVLIDPTSPIPDLLTVAINTRPELGARNARIAEGDAHLRQEIARPFLPTVSVGFSAGGFGGGSNLVPPLLGRFGGRSDFDVIAFWTLRNLGLGNLAIQKQRRAVIGAAVAEQARTINRVRDEVVASRASAQAAFAAVQTARKGIATATDGVRDDLRLVETGGTVNRRLDGQSLVIALEALNSIDFLFDIRTTFVNAVVENNKAQFALHVALGTPPPLQDDLPTASGPIAPAPIAAPPTPAVAPPHTPLPDIGMNAGE